MPASPFSVWVNILGSVSPSVNAGISSVTRQLNTLQATVRATNRMLIGGIGSMLGFTAAVIGIRSVADGVRKVIDLSLQHEQIELSTLTLLRNQRLLRGQNASLAEDDLKTLNAQAQSLQQQTGIYEQIFERGTMILASTHRNAYEIQGLQNSIANLLAYQRMQGKSAESLQETYLAIGKAIQTGMARNLNQVGVILTPMEKRWLEMNAMTGHVADNVKLIEIALNRTYAGMAKIRMGTLTGQMDLAIANMYSSFNRIGDVLRPIGQRLTIIFTQIIPTIEPVIIRLGELIGGALERHMKDIQDWINLIQRTAIPVMVKWINVGWQKMQDLIKWFQLNRDWVLPWIKNLTVLAGIIGVIVGIILPIAGIILAMVGPVNLVVAGVVALGVAIYTAITNWREFRRMMEGAADWIFGTKFLDPLNQGYSKGQKGPYGVRRGFRPGEVPRAQLVQPGWLPQIWDQFKVWWKGFSDWFMSKINTLWDTIWTTIQTNWNKFTSWTTDQLKNVWNTFYNWLSPEAQKNLNTIKENGTAIWTGFTENLNKFKSTFLEIWGALVEWWKSNVAPTLPVVWDKIVEVMGKIRDVYMVALKKGIEGIIEITNILLGAVRDVGDAWNTVWDWIDKIFHAKPPGQEKTGQARPEPLPDPNRRRRTGVASIDSMPGGVRVTHYGYPWDPTPDTNTKNRIGGWNNFLSNPWMGWKGGPTTVALSPGLVQQWGLTRGQHFMLGGHEWIYQDIVPRFWKDKHGVIHENKGLRFDVYDPYGTWKGFPAGSKFGRPTPLKPDQPQNVTINYTVHHHGSGGEHELAQFHRHNIDKLKRDLAEVIWRDNRSSFDGARATG